MKKISVIVPIYNVEKYLHRCVDSIINQTYKNLEIILVDDGSSDNCPKICDEYAKKDDRIKVIHKENGGLSDARNAGLDVASGNYIGFVDSDDYINESMYEILAEELEKNESDMVVCKLKVVFDEEIILNEKKYDLMNLTNKDALERLYENDFEFGGACNKLYKKQIFNYIRYPVGKINEDAFTTYKLLFNSNRVTYIDCVLYYYYQRIGSIMRSIVTKKNLDIIEALEEREHFFRENELDDLIPLNDRALFVWTVSLYNSFREKKEKKLYLQLKEKKKILYNRIKKQEDLCFLDKVKYKLCNYIPFLYSYRKKVKNFFLNKFS